TASLISTFRPSVTSSSDEPMRIVLISLRLWPALRWLFAFACVVAITAIISVPTDLIDTPWFTRDIPPTVWAWPVLLVTSALAGLVSATYVNRKDTGRARRGGVLGGLGAAGSLFAVGCPVCNKLVLIALGYAGALQYFAPAQPYLAVAAVVLLAVALVQRIRRE